jgi:cytochrome c553
MDKGFQHLHYTVVILFLAFLIYKTLLLLLNKNEALDKVREKTKIIDIILGSLILITGGFLLFRLHSGNIETYLIIKIILVFAAIPLGIIGIKRKKKALAILSVLIFVYVWGIAVKRNANVFAGRKAEPSSVEKAGPGGIMDENKTMNLDNAKAIYTSQCARCHGEDGKAGVGGAKDLSVSTLSLQEKENIIINGKGIMPPFGNLLTESEVKAVAAYIESFKK